MHHEFGAVDAALGEFVEQPDYPTLVCDSSDIDVVFAFKMLQARDRADGNRIYLLLPYDCDEVGEYLGRCVAALDEQVRAENGARATAGQPLWPALPLVCGDPRQPPSVRLRHMIEHVRSLVPDGVDIVWAWMPATIKDAAGYREMIMPLLSLDGVEGWMEGHRFCIRDDSARPFLVPHLFNEKVDHALVLRFDFSAQKAADVLVGSLNDTARPMAERMQAARQLAALDLTHGRFESALEKYRLLHAYHRRQNDPAGQALALGGVGDVAKLQALHAQAKEAYLQALAPAAASSNLTVILNLLMSLGACCVKLNQHAEAVGHFELAARAADKLMFPHTAIAAMEKLGVALLKCGNSIEAARTWADAKALSERFRSAHQRRSLLERLAALYAQAGLTARAKSYELEMKTEMPPRACASTANPSREHDVCGARSA